ncbi:MAG: chromate efflux transporter [Magnetococcales bacterium]|nr:chromate efflux transporter [Magnetococcales bacterium]
MTTQPTQSDATPTPANEPAKPGVLEVLLIFFGLGLTSFGGPVAHIGYFREAFVARRKWLSESAYADLVAMCQFLPGPASSQVGMGLGMMRAGLPGALAAWVGFTLPSALVMILFAYGVTSLDLSAQSGWIHGLKVVAVAVVAQAVWGMATTLCPDRNRATLAIVAALLVTLWPTALGQVSAILIGALFGWRFLSLAPAPADGSITVSLSRRWGVIFLILFALLLLALPLLAEYGDTPILAITDSFYRSGSLVFGGGHVVLPLLQAEVVPSGWLDNELFLAGYGAAQAVPGPLFTFAAYLGSAMSFGPSGWLGGLLATVAVFLPSFLLVAGMLPFWQAFRTRPGAQSILAGVNAAVVGLLVAALYHPVWTSGILSASDFMLALAAFGLLQFWKTAPWLVVVAASVVSGILA